MRFVSPIYKSIYRQGKKISKTKFAAHMRDNPTSCERRMWKILRDYGFRRQCQIGPYIVDFWHKRWRLVVEVDGPHHQTWTNKLYDERRDHCIWKLGHEVWHYRWDDDFTTILERLEKRMPIKFKQLQLKLKAKVQHDNGIPKG